MSRRAGLVVVGLAVVLATTTPTLEASIDHKLAQLHARGSTMCTDVEVAVSLVGTAWSDTRGLLADRSTHCVEVDSLTPLHTPPTIGEITQ